ncbi:MAG: type II restriction endonuclease [Brevundimonas subvibrioides]|uniref:Type II restriction endonuclease n=1 Tax=Brevundimonas subvibrioides TaxID=74313 RepID=A0A258HS30_9CAUL|nr:type II restriction endonuclease [Brevundimonas subvibrioides]OYX59162.1 MAG: type II restriction endonuclease [Brevundimonas subvibrioides]
MPMMSLPDWIAEFSRPDHVWYLKRLSANDTLANATHQAGPYIPKELLFRVLPGLHNREAENPRVQVDAFVDSGTEVRSVTAIWYNNRHRGGTRDEARVTGWGGSASALLDPDSTGALAVFVFENGALDSGATAIHVWVCNGYQDEMFEDVVGPVDPGKAITWRPGEPISLFAAGSVRTSCSLRPSEMPPHWLERFPSAAEIVRRSVELQALQSQTPDDRLVRRRKCEFEIFKSVEEALEGPKVEAGFRSLDEFLVLAQTILQRRKSRSGRSLELHAREIFLEEGLVEHQQFSHGATSEGDKKPDFLFPSAQAYADQDFPKERLRMLAAKTTARDRWRQVLNEADRVSTKHLLTLQEGVSENQFAEMEAANLQLVIPASLIDAFPESVRPKLITLDSFIYQVRGLR